MRKSKNLKDNNEQNENFVLVDLTIITILWWALEKAHKSVSTYTEIKVWAGGLN